MNPLVGLRFSGASQPFPTNLPVLIDEKPDADRRSRTDQKKASYYFVEGDDADRPVNYFPDAKQKQKQSIAAANSGVFLSTTKSKPQGSDVQRKKPLEG
mmetsp:Transcript_3627/g.8647  ORF Transcript_3627/g.8647 Transcript_3627/m.8647 type:complete len:99 (-) Transcript_3627:253-549(-)